MPDFLGLMKQAAELKSKMESMQAELDRMEVEGTAGGGMLTVKMSGKGELRGVLFHGRRYDTGNKLDYLRTLVQFGCDGKMGERD